MLRGRLNDRRSFFAPRLARIPDKNLSPIKLARVLFAIGVRAAKLPLAPEKAPRLENLVLGEPTGSRSYPGRVAAAHVQADLG